MKKTDLVSIPRCFEIAVRKRRKCPFPHDLLDPVRTSTNPWPKIHPSSSLYSHAITSAFYPHGIPRISSLKHGLIWDGLKMGPKSIGLSQFITVYHHVPLLIHICWGIPDPKRPSRAWVHTCRSGVRTLSLASEGRTMASNMPPDAACRSPAPQTWGLGGAQQKCLEMFDV